MRYSKVNKTISNVSFTGTINFHEDESIRGNITSDTPLDINDFEVTTSSGKKKVYLFRSRIDKNVYYFSALVVPDTIGNFVIKYKQKRLVYEPLNQFIKPSNFLSPKDLEVADVQLENILLVGQCLSRRYIEPIVLAEPALKLTHAVINGVSVLNEIDVTAFKLQLIVLPLEDVIGGGFIFDYQKIFNKSDWEAKLFACKTKLKLMLEGSLTMAKTGLLTIVHNFILPQTFIETTLKQNYTLRRLICELNNYIADLVETMSNVFILDVEAISSSFGKMYFLDDIYYPTLKNRPEIQTHNVNIRSIYKSLTAEYGKTIYNQLKHIYKVFTQHDQIKLVIFDLDNTLWSGVIGEGDNIKSQIHKILQQSHHDAWANGMYEAILLLRSRGVLVSIVSKNNLQTVQKAFPKLTRTFLDLNMFIAPMINWETKTDNINNILQQTKLLAKNVLFVDDNQHEREEVAKNIPSIRIIGSNQFLSKRLLLWSPELQIANYSHESKLRHNSLEFEQERISIQAASNNREEYLKSLQLKITITDFSTLVDDETKHHTLVRCFELLNKTNQFNTTSMKWSLLSLRQFPVKTGKLFFFTVTDRFADFGTVGVLLIDTETNKIIQMVMSCRVIGLDVENEVLLYIKNTLPKPLNAILIKTDVNIPCHHIFEKQNFVLTSQNDNIISYTLND